MKSHLRHSSVAVFILMLFVFSPETKGWSQDHNFETKAGQAGKELFDDFLVEGAVIDKVILTAVFVASLQHAPLERMVWPTQDEGKNPEDHIHPQHLTLEEYRKAARLEGCFEAVSMYDENSGCQEGDIFWLSLPQQVDYDSGRVYLVEAYDPVRWVAQVEEGEMTATPKHREYFFSQHRTKRIIRPGICLLRPKPGALRKFILADEEGPSSKLPNPMYANEPLALRSKKLFLIRQSIKTWKFKGDREEELLIARRGTMSDGDDKWPGQFLFYEGANEQTGLFIPDLLENGDSPPLYAKQKDSDWFRSPNKLTPIPAVDGPDGLYAKKKPVLGGIPVGISIPGKPGFCTSPFDPDALMIDVTGIAPGTKVKCPYTGKIFLVP